MKLTSEKGQLSSGCWDCLSRNSH